MKTKFIFIRHAQSIAKEKNIVQGMGLEIPLAKDGDQQAVKLGEALKDFEFDLICSSTSERSKKTAEYIRKYHADKPYQEIFNLNERSKGTAEGITKEEFAWRYPEVLEAWSREEDPRVAGGENFQDVENRVKPIIEKHLTEYAGKTIIYVTHGNLIRVVIGYMLGMPVNLRNRIQQDYCALNSAEYDHDKKRWLVNYVNRTI